MLNSYIPCGGKSSREQTENPLLYLFDVPVIYILFSKLFGERELLEQEGVLRTCSQMIPNPCLAVYLRFDLRHHDPLWTSVS